MPEAKHCGGLRTYVYSCVVKKDRLEHLWMLCVPLAVGCGELANRINREPCIAIPLNEQTTLVKWLVNDAVPLSPHLQVLSAQLGALTSPSATNDEANKKDDEDVGAPSQVGRARCCAHADSQPRGQRRSRLPPLQNSINCAVSQGLTLQKGNS